MSSVPKRSCMMGIDPGVSGAIIVAMACPDISGGYVVVDVLDLGNTRWENKSQLDGSYLDPRFSYEFIDGWMPYCQGVVIEDVQVQGTAASQTAMFKMGQVKGLLLGIVAAVRAANNYASHLVAVKPQVWKPALGLGKDKGLSLRLARHHYPNNHALFSLKKHHDRAEAALLAVCGFKIFIGGKDATSGNLKKALY